MLAPLIYVGFLIFLLVYEVLVLWLAARWLRAMRPTLARASIAMLVLLLLNALSLATLSMANSPAGQPSVAWLLVALVAFAACVTASCATIWLVLRLSFGRAVIAWLIVDACGLLAMPIASFVVRPHVMEWYQASANSMAPTIVAWHADVTCPHCGGAAFAGMELPASRSFGTPETHNWAICSNCRQTSRHEVSGLALRAPDRIAVDKLAAPRRWDVVVQRAAYDPNVLHVFRLVGMPGESIEIKEGSVYANGEKLEPPPGIGLRYEMPENLPASAVSEFQTAWELGATEVITLGDNSRFSNDSRFQGPVLFSDLVGVVRWRCWPPDRWGNVR